MPFVVRDAVDADYGVFARLFPELGVDDPLASHEQFAARMLSRTVILEEDGRARGYAFWQAYGATAHVVHVVVDPLARGRGAGRSLMDAIELRVRREGCARWYLNVKQENAPAIRLYERCGMRIELEGWALRTAWSQIALLPASPAGPVAFAPGVEDDSVLAACFDLDPERLALLRARPGFVLLALREADAPVAFAAFDPAFPGVHTVRVAYDEATRALFDALHPHAREDRVFIFVEGNRALLEALERVGAERRHSLFRMGAPLAGPTTPRR
jgi:GNAT superfamily N-acetyltransferase